MSKRIKIMISIVTVLVIVIGATFAIKTYAAVSAKEKLENEAVATVNKVNITRKDFDLAKKNVERNGSTMTDEDILYKLVSNEAILQEAKKNGFDMTDEEALKVTKAQEEAIKKTDSYTKLKAYLKETGMSEREYWKDAAVKTKNASIRNKYKEALKTAFAQKNKIVDMNSLETKFGDYFEEVTNEIMVVADIKVLMKY